ncbi:MAG: hypothetical protein ACBZ72_03880 [Candidatus Bathyarchaeia archaeon]
MGLCRGEKRRGTAGKGAAGRVLAPFGLNQLCTRRCLSKTVAVTTPTTAAAIAPTKRRFSCKPESPLVVAIEGDGIGCVAVDEGLGGAVVGGAAEEGVGDDVGVCAKLGVGVGAGAGVWYVGSGVPYPAGIYCSLTALGSNEPMKSLKLNVKPPTV